MSAARKRPPDDNSAECPFSSIRVVDPNDKAHRKKKRKTQLQSSPFAPSGNLRTFETMDIHLQVEPTKGWTDMTRYNSFVLNGIKHFNEGFIYVVNESSIERRKAVASKEKQLQVTDGSDDDWVARILEIRASDEYHVYARIYWMYWPDELPPGTQDGKRLVQGRQPYHGINELIASNHMDIINVLSISSPATVNQWFEEKDDEVQIGLYWRQAFDVRTHEITTVEHLCKCGEPGNPDKTLIGCTNEPCKKWLHEECIKKEALMDVYKRLGPDKPYVPRSSVKETDVKDSKRPLSPAETETAATAQQSIDVKADANAFTAPEDATEASSSAPKAEEIASHPWEGLFDVSLRMDCSPPMVEFKDLREDIQSGTTTWMEPIKCLVCGAESN